jgi:TrmH family RNA methyltransferase
MKLIQSRDNPLYKKLSKLATSARYRAECAETLLEGVHLLAAYLEAGKVPKQLVVTGAALDNSELAALLAHLPETNCTLLDDRLFGGLSELKTPTGILALMGIPSPARDVEASRFALLLEDIQDPGNLGSMLRSAAAAGCDSVFLSQGCADAWSPRVLRAGMGGHFQVAIHENAVLTDVAGRFPGAVYATAPEADASLYDSKLQGNLAFAVGNEGAGLSAALMAVAQPLRIPMPGRLESLNAAAATAICLFEAVRQQQQSR